MLQALLHHKLGRAIQNGSFHVIEDTLTSSVIGVLQYLPDDLFWSILRDSCGAFAATLPENVGKVTAVRFWERLDAEGTYNARIVEPDVWIETEMYDIIIEAKRSDSPFDNPQSHHQWLNEIVSLENANSYEGRKEIILLALGGNDNLKDKSFDLGGKLFSIHAGSWFNILNAILRCKESLENDIRASGNVVRILDDALAALDVHNVIRTVWLDSLPGITMDELAVVTLTHRWEFDNRAFFSPMIGLNYKLQIDSLNNIWTATSAN